MTTLKEPGPTSLKGSDWEEDTAEEPHYRTPEGRHVEALLDISEETLVEPEPHEHHCASGWEEAVRGWARVAPLSCILSSQKPHRKTKHKDAGSPSLPNAERSAGVESRTGSANGVRKSLHQQTGCCNTPQAGASGWAMQRTPSTEEGSAPSPSLPSAPEHGPTKPRKHGSKPVPIKNFAFLPPIRPPQRQPALCDHLCSGVKASDEEALRQRSFLVDRRSVAGARWGPAVSPVYPAALLSTCPTCQHDLSLFSAVSVSVPKRYRAPASSRRDAGHCSSFSMGTGLTPALHSAAAPGYLFS